MDDAEKYNVESEPLFETLFTQSITLSEVYIKNKNYHNLAWLLLTPSKSKFLKKNIESLKKGVGKLAKEYIKSKEIDTNLFITMSITDFVCLSNNQNAPNDIKKALFLTIKELKNNERLRTCDLVGTILIGVAEVFDEFGEHVTIKVIDCSAEKNEFTISDKGYHLSKNKSKDLMKLALDGYKEGRGKNPDITTVHKTSPFLDEEKNGFIEALSENCNLVYVNRKTHFIDSAIWLPS